MFRGYLIENIIHPLAEMRIPFSEQPFSILSKKYTVLKLSEGRFKFYNCLLKSSPEFCIIKYTSQIMAFSSAFILSLLSSHNRM